MAFKWITEDIPFDVGNRAQGAKTLEVDSDAFDISISDLPLNLHIDEAHQYERLGARWQKEQFDNLSHVGEQSLVGWWLRSQLAFNGGGGITYFEPLHGREISIETRFRDSRGVDVLREDGEVHLLPETVALLATGSSDIDLKASDTRLLILDGTTVRVHETTTDAVSMPGGSVPTNLAYTGGKFLIGHATGVAELDAASGLAASALWTGATDPVSVWWLKQRIFAASGRKVFELTLAGGSMPATPLYEHPDPNWTWDSMAETGAAVWMAGHSGDKSAIHVVTIESDGSTPTLAGATVGIQLPDGEIVNEILGYLDFIVVATNRGLRIAFVQGSIASLGPLIFTEPAYAVAARGDFVWAGLDQGLTRKVDLGRSIAGDLTFAFANDLESSGAGRVTAFAFWQGELIFGHGATGVMAPGADLRPDGYLSTGFIRYGVLEPKFFESVRTSADTSAGLIELLTTVNEEQAHVASLANFVGSRDTGLSLPAEGKVDRLSLTFKLVRSATDPTVGPVFRGYQLRALPAPSRRQRLIQFPVKLLDRERDRFGNTRGGPRFAWARLQKLEKLEESGVPVVMRDFRTGEARTCIIESVSHIGTASPSRELVNFGGRVVVTIRTVD